MAVKRVVVHIDRVTLRGVDAVGRRKVLEGFQQALVEQLELPGAAGSLASMGHRPSLTVRAGREPGGDWIRSAGAALGRELTR
ncbi:MAG: hypothetical protein ACRDKW_11445 [Actinomycetota bacterium]